MADGLGSSSLEKADGWIVACIGGADNPDRGRGLERERDGLAYRVGSEAIFDRPDDPGLTLDEELEAP